MVLSYHAAMWNPHSSIRSFHYTFKQQFRQDGGWFPDSADAHLSGLFVLFKPAGGVHQPSLYHYGQRNIITALLGSMADPDEPAADSPSSCAC